MQIKRGRKPTTPAIKSFPGAPEPPKDLSDVARQAWHSVCSDLHTQGTLNSTNRALIELYARTFDRYEAIRNQLDKEPLKWETEKNCRINPLVNAEHNYASKLRQLLSDLQLTPKSQGKTDEQVIDSKWADFEVA